MFFWATLPTGLNEWMRWKKWNSAFLQITPWLYSLLYVFPRLPTLVVPESISAVIWKTGLCISFLSCIGKSAVCNENGGAHWTPLIHHPFPFQSAHLTRVAIQLEHVDDSLILFVSTAVHTFVDSCHCGCLQWTSATAPHFSAHRHKQSWLSGKKVPGKRPTEISIQNDGEVGRRIKHLQGESHMSTRSQVNSSGWARPLPQRDTHSSIFHVYLEKRGERLSGAKKLRGRSSRGIVLGEGVCMHAQPQIHLSRLQWRTAPHIITYTGLSGDPSGSASTSSWPDHFANSLHNITCSRCLHCIIGCRNGHAEFASAVITFVACS